MILNTIKILRFKNLFINFNKLKKIISMKIIINNEFYYIKVAIKKIIELIYKSILNLNKFDIL